MNKLILTAIFMIIGMNVYAAAPDINVGSATGFSGALVSIPIIADFSVSVGSSQFVLKFDPNLLTLGNITVGSGNTGWFITSFSPSPGTINIGMFSTTGIPISGTAQQIVVINFTVNAIPGSATLTSPNLDLTSVYFDNNSISTITNGNFSLGILGDVNGDSKVTIADAQLVAQEVVGSTTLTPTQITASEVDGNSKVDIYDAFLIVQYSLGIITKI